jgi:hypothetical protein
VLGCCWHQCRAPRINVIIVTIINIMSWQTEGNIIIFAVMVNNGAMAQTSYACIPTDPDPNRSLD